MDGRTMKLNRIKPRLAVLNTNRLPMAHDIKVKTAEKLIEGAWRPVEVVHRLRGRALQTARLRIWTAAPHCAMCGRLVAYPAGFELDHIVGVAHHESSNDDANMQVLCVDKVDGRDVGCHAAKSSAERVRMGARG
jgi:5-methylcytosine-specific restriction protein A